MAFKRGKAGNGYQMFRASRQQLGGRECCGMGHVVFGVYSIANLGRNGLDRGQ
jgi:hypothetical protein